MASSDDEQRLAGLLLERHFGSLCQKVGCLLIKKGRLSVAQIAAAFPSDSSAFLPIKSIKEALFVLVHHFVVFWGESEEKGRRNAFYHLHLPSLFIRLAFPSMIECVCEAFPAQREHFAEEMKTLLLHARIPVKHYAAPHQKAFLEEMRRKRFVEIIFVSAAVVDGGVGVEKVASEHAPSFDPCSLEKKSTSWQKKEATETRKKPVSTAAAPKDCAQKAPAKRKLLVDSDDEKPPTDSGSVTQDCFVRANYLRFVCSFRNAFLVEHFARKYNESTGIVLHELLEIDFANPPNQLASFFQLEKALSSKAAGSSFFLTKFEEAAANQHTILSYDASSPQNSLLSKYVDVLVADAAGVVVRRDAMSGGLFAIDQRAISRLLSARTLQSLVLERLGSTAMRIFNLLRIENAVMDEKIICKSALIDVKAARETLVKLLKWGVICSQEIPRTPDHMPSRTFFMWKFIPENGSKAIRKHLLKTLGNLLERSKMEYSANFLLVQKTERSDVRENPSLLSSSEQSLLKALHKNMDQINFYSVKLSEMLLTIN